MQALRYLTLYCEPALNNIFVLIFKLVLNFVVALIH